MKLLISLPGSPGAKSTPHLCISALATWSQDTSLCRNWKKQFARIPVFTHTKGTINLPLMTIQAGSATNTVTFSTDGTRIVSGSNDHSVRVWGVSTGAELNVMKGHIAWVNSVAFSSDSTRIVPGSRGEVDYYLCIDGCRAEWDEGPHQGGQLGHVFK